MGRLARLPRRAARRRSCALGGAGRETLEEFAARGTERRAASATATPKRHFGADCPNQPAVSMRHAESSEHTGEAEPERELVEAVEHARRDQADREPAERAAARGAEVVGGERARGRPQPIELAVEDHAGREQEQPVARDLEWSVPPTAATSAVPARSICASRARSRRAPRAARTGSGGRRAGRRSRGSASRDRSRAAGSRGTGRSRRRGTDGW